MMYGIRNIGRSPAHLTKKDGAKIVLLPGKTVPLSELYGWTLQDVVDVCKNHTEDKVILEFIDDDD